MTQNIRNKFQQRGHVETPTLSNVCVEAFTSLCLLQAWIMQDDQFRMMHYQRFWLRNVILCTTQLLWRNYKSIAWFCKPKSAFFVSKMVAFL